MKKITMTVADIEQFKNKVMLELTSKKGLPERINMDVNPSVTLKENEKAEVCFENEAFKKMKALISTCDKEIGWYGIVKRTSERKFVVKDILMFPQTVTGSTVQTDDEEFISWESGLSDEEFTGKTFYGHSHVNMGVSPSGTDLEFQDNLLQNVTDFYIFGIFNKKNDHWLNIYDVKNNILYENKDIEYTYYESEAETWAKGVIEKYVKEPKKPLVSPVKPGSWREYYAQYYKGGYHNSTPTGGGVAKNDWSWDYDD